MDEARIRREAAPAANLGVGRTREAAPAAAAVAAAPVMNPPHHALTEVTSPGSSPSLTGPACLSEAIRAVAFSK